MAGATVSADVFRAVADATRRAILAMLLESDRTVTDLQQPFRMSQPAISQHLRVLREAGLVRSKRAGRRTVYRLNPKPIEQVYEWARTFRELRDPSGHVWRIHGKENYGNPGNKT